MEKPFLNLPTKRFISFLSSKSKQRYTLVPLTPVSCMAISVSHPSV